MSRVEEYCKLVQEYVDTLPAFPNTERGDKANALHEQLAELFDQMDEHERQEADVALGTFHAA
jgi:hypothetical protein